MVSFRLKEGIFLEKLSSLEAFYMGLKPAFFVTTASEKFMKGEFRKISAKYPYIDQGVELMKDETCYLFFQDDSKKERFLDRIQGLTPDHLEFHRILGLTLGYPPNSVDFFVRKEQLKRQQDSKGVELQKMSIVLSHCGCSFLTHVSQMVEEAQWLWKTYIYEEPLHISLVDQGLWKTLEVPYLDVQSLQKMQERVHTILIKNRDLLYI